MKGDVMTSSTVNRIILVFVCTLVLGLAARAADTHKIPTGSKVFIAPMENGFNDDLRAALEAKKVPLTVVNDKKDADYEITGASETQKAGAAKKALMLNWHSNEQASISIADLKSGEVVFAYSVNKKSSAHGKRSTAEACAKHINDDAIVKK
jgi:hypothetical protein